MKKEKQRSGDDLCWGRKPVFSLLERSPERCMKVLASKSVQPHIRSRLKELCTSANIVLMTVEPAAVERLVGKDENHQGVVAYVAPVRLWETEEFISILPPAPNPVLLLLCDHLQDPHNLGAVIRSAETAGASGVLIPKRGGALPTGTVIKTSAGAAFRLPIVKTGNVTQTIKILQDAGFWVVGLSMDAEETLFKEDLPPRTAIVVGSEGEGLGRLAAKSCDELRYIPMQGEVGSLNASIAAALAMFEWKRSSLQW